MSQGKPHSTSDQSTSSRVLLYGFTGDQRHQAKARLSAAKFKVVYQLSEAHMIVFKGTLPSAMEREAKLKRIPALSLEEALEMGNLTDDLEPLSERQDYLVRPMVEDLGEHVRFLDLMLPKRASSTAHAGRVVPLEAHQGLCLDQGFVHTAYKVASSALYDLPCVLEGPTATSKTTVVRWFASLLGQPVYRINLNGQTDTGELIGRYVPSDAGHALEDEALIQERERFTELSTDPLWVAAHTDLERAHAEGRTLSPVERARVAKALNLQSAQWSFVEGLIVKALRYGAWVILDEMNLAEPQILERLNSVLEDDKSLVLTESDHTMFGPGGDVSVHPEVRLFGTMNPTEYAGRSPLSPAFRDRWRLWSFVNHPSEEDLQSMLHFMVYGEHPVVEFKGQFYQAEPTTPLYPDLQELDDVDELLKRLSVFHYQLSLAAGDGGQAKIGRTRRDRYVFTRRNLIAALKILNAQWAQERTKPEMERLPSLKLLSDVIQIIYLARIQEGADLAAVRAAQSAAGLSV